MANVIEELRERGFVEQTTHDQELYEYVDQGNITCYIGFDPTASSLHIGSLVPIMSLAHMQRHGHRPIALVGGGTGLVGDPSGKTEMRKLLTPETIEENAMGIKQQLSRFLDFSDGKAIMLNNADWLTKLGYISFLRDVGRHFSVNRMIKAESCKIRLDSEDGLSFIEFNYMVLQAYDFLELCRSQGCRLQMGGSDQWGNIVAGVELIRRMEQQTAFGVTFPLITTSSGEKMGKTAKGAIWLDPERTSPYEYYQYWVNTDDRDVARFLALFTFLPMDEIRAIKTLGGSDLNSVKAVLAFEATLLAHGKEQSLKAYQAAVSMFGRRDIPDHILPSSSVPRGGADQEDVSVPHSYVEADKLKVGIPAFMLFHDAGLAASNGAARRLIQQGGAYINGQRIDDFDQLITEQDLGDDNAIVLRSGKKRFHKILVQS
ncbi:MAG: tyrosine--tRNA ligase [Desulfobacteraceae bacterium]|jgi:tyrosyl-tRNA synthetase|nr:tyrosine--tRNA ligase [Desulfobacteraceae bacterium]